MVVGGYSKYKNLKNPETNECIEDENGECKKNPGLINDVELLSLEEGNFCTKVVSPIFGRSYLLGEDEDGFVIENEAETLGLTGVFSKDTAIVCGGKNGDGDLNSCYEWNSEINKYDESCMICSNYNNVIHCR